MIHFYTLFPPAENVHILKDVGMIPYVLYRDYGYESTLVAFRKNDHFLALENEACGLKMNFIDPDPHYRFGKPSYAVIKYIWKNASKMDVLNLYHNTKETLLYGLIYKMRNTKGVLYIKLDLNVERFEQCLTRWKHIGYSFFFEKIASIVSYELDGVGIYLHSSFPFLKSKLIKITNGIDDRFIADQHIRIYSFDEKENLIVVVGRIGAPEKNHELFLKALNQIDLKDWRVAFIGPVEQSFQIVVNDFFVKHPNLKDKVIFTGAIYDRKILYSWYNRAKVFCLTSWWESFAIVLVEALYFANYIITSRISSAEELTDYERIGRVFSSDDEFVELLQCVVNGNIHLEDFYDSIRDYSRNFVWKDILKPLNFQIEKVING